MNAFLCLELIKHCRSPPVLTSFQMQLISEMEDRTMVDEEVVVKQFMSYCRKILKCEKIDYYRERKYIQGNFLLNV